MNMLAHPHLRDLLQVCSIVIDLAQLQKDTIFFSNFYEMLAMCLLLEGYFLPAKFQYNSLSNF